MLVRPRPEFQALQDIEVCLPWHRTRSPLLIRSDFTPLCRYHTKALRSVIYHRTYPLFASASDDGTIQIFHGTVYSDLMQNPLIVPLKVLRGHNIKDGLGVLDVKWHPTKPWLISSGADGEVRMWT